MKESSLYARYAPPGCGRDHRAKRGVPPIIMWQLEAGMTVAYRPIRGDLWAKERAGRRKKRNCPDVKMPGPPGKNAVCIITEYREGARLVCKVGNLHKHRQLPTTMGARPLRFAGAHHTTKKEPGWGHNSGEPSGTSPAIDALVPSYQHQQTRMQPGNLRAQERRARRKSKGRYAKYARPC